jgi:hypothetical protein
MSGALKEKAATAAENQDEIKCIALGAEDTAEEIAEVQPVPQEVSVDARLSELEQRMFYILNSLDSLFQMVKQMRDESSKEEDAKINQVIEKKKKEQKLEIPEGITLHGTTNGLSYFCKVKSDGFYVGEKHYDSLSAAAEGISGTRRSGWTFWKLSDGRTVKEVYRS